MKKNNYEAPEAELFVVRLEGNMLQWSGQNQKFQAAGIYDGDWEDEDY